MWLMEENQRTLAHMASPKRYNKEEPIYKCVIRQNLLVYKF